MITIDITSGCQLEYFAEGAANIVYRINPIPQSPSIAADLDFDDFDVPVTEVSSPRLDAGFEGKLVRLRKATKSTVTVLESHKYYETAIFPLFPGATDLVAQTLFHPTLALLAELNRRLKAMESQKSRSSNRHGTYLAEDEDHGLLVTDMSSCNSIDADYRSFEFKPKWLLRSPSAPADAIRCRTCALRQFRSSQGQIRSTAESSAEFCPLGLVSKEKTEVALTMERITGLDPRTKRLSPHEDIVRRRLIDFIHGNSLLSQLRDLQANLDQCGVLGADETGTLSTAMTLRDCTLFTKV